MKWTCKDMIFMIIIDSRGRFTSPLGVTYYESSIGPDLVGMTLRYLWNDRPMHASIGVRAA